MAARGLLCSCRGPVLLRTPPSPPPPPPASAPAPSAPKAPDPINPLLLLPLMNKLPPCPMLSPRASAEPVARAERSARLRARVVALLFRSSSSIDCFLIRRSVFRPKKRKARIIRPKQQLMAKTAQKDDDGYLLVLIFGGIRNIFYLDWT
jgi:hypothetical protein